MSDPSMPPIRHPAQWCQRHELWWSGPYKNCPVCHMAQWYPEPDAILAPAGAPQATPKPPATCSEAGSTRALTDAHELLNTMDGVVWAKEFCRITGFTDEGWAIAWFCNAIMAGYDEATRRIDRDLAKAWSEPSAPVETSQAEDRVIRDRDGVVLCPHGRPMTCAECGEDYAQELESRKGVR